MPSSITAAMAHFAELDRVFQDQLARGAVEEELADRHLEAAEAVLRESASVGPPGEIDSRKLLASVRRDPRATITVRVEPLRVDPIAFEARDDALTAKAADIHRRAAETRTQATAGGVKLALQALALAAGTRK